MDVIMVIAVGVGGGIFGLIAGYVIRYAQTAGKKGSVELEVKQMLLSGKEEAQKIIQESEKKAEADLVADVTEQEEGTGYQIMGIPQPPKDK